jgi:hypothetical protein
MQEVRKVESDVSIAPAESVSPNAEVANNITTHLTLHLTLLSIVTSKKQISFRDLNTF